MTPTQITAKVIAYSRCKRTGRKIITLEIEYPRFIHGEFLTHRLFSRNAASSRAIPIKKMIEQVETNPAMPIHWGANQAGMQAKSELSGALQVSAKWLWKKAAKAAAAVAKLMDKLGLHKQVVNRVLEPFQIMKTVVTATDWENFLWLRDHEDAQPEIRALAQAIIEAIEQYGEPEDLNHGEWHTPYVTHLRDCFGNLMYLSGPVPEFSHQTQVLPTITLQQALAISSSCCAQVSFRVLNDSLTKAEDIFDKLVHSEPVHASPFEHQATPMKEGGEFWDEDGSYELNWIDPVNWEEGITHIDKYGHHWSGNLCGFIQHRQLIPNNVKRG